MKKILWTSAMALAAVACLTACDDTSSSSYEIPSYKSETALPDTCEMEVAKVDTAYFACFENNWVEVTDSATLEKIKEGLDEEDLKKQIEKLEETIEDAEGTTDKPKASADKGGSDPESSASGEECADHRCKEKSSSSKKGSGKGGSGSVEEVVNKCGDKTYNIKTQYCKDGTTPTDMPKCSDAEDALLYNPETQYCKASTTPTDMPKCGEAEDSPLYNPEARYCNEGTLISLTEAVVVAAKAGNVTMLEELDAVGAKFEERDTGTEGFFPIHWAVKSGKVEAVQFFINKGVDVNAKSSNGWSVLDWATNEGYSQIIKALKKAGAKNTAQYFKDSKT